MDIPNGVTGIKFHVSDQIDEVAHVWELSRRAHGTIRWRIGLLSAIKVRVGSAGGQELEGFRAQRFIARAHAAVAKIARDEVGRLSQRRWLHILRRLPSDWTSDRTGYVMSLFEAFTGLAGSTNEEEDLADRFHISASDGQPLARVAIAIGCMADLHLAYRQAGRGYRIRISDSGWPVALADERLEAARRTYDARLRTFQQTSRHYPQVGTICVERGAPSFESTTMVMGVLSCKNPDWRVTVDLQDSTIGHATFTNFVPKGLSFSPLRHLHGSDSPSGQLGVRDLATCIAFLAASSTLLTGDSNDQSHALGLGFCQLSRSDVESFFSARFFLAQELLASLGIEQAGPQSSLDLIKRAAEISPKLWPIRIGPLIRHGRDRSILDLHAATERLLSSISAPQGGPAANVRSSHFEDVVQTVIDRTPWCPEPSTRVIRSRHLRVGDKVIGEIDAIGRREDTLLVVSCKGRTLTTGLEKGQARAARNVQTLVVESATALDTFARAILANPKGANFDFSWVKAIERCVCLPQPFFVSPDSALILDQLDNARVVGVNELDWWLDQSDQRP